MASEGRIRTLLNGAIEEALKHMTQLLRSEVEEIRLQAATSILETWVQLLNYDDTDKEDWQR